jgi:hypothetical protein
MKVNITVFVYCCSGLVVLGSKLDMSTHLPTKGTGFLGCLARVGAWNRKLTDQEILDLSADKSVTSGQLLGWEGYDLYGGVAYTPAPADRAKVCPVGSGGTNCKDSVPGTLSFSPTPKITDPHNEARARTAFASIQSIHRYEKKIYIVYMAVKQTNYPVNVSFKNVVFCFRQEAPTYHLSKRHLQNPWYGLHR